MYRQSLDKKQPLKNKKQFQKNQKVQCNKVQISKYYDSSLQQRKFKKSKSNKILSKPLTNKENINIVQPQNYDSKYQHHRVKSEYFEESHSQNRKIFTPVIQKKILFIKKQPQQLSIYQKSLRDSSAKRSWIQKQIRIQNKRQLQQCTYVPKINNISRQIAKKSRYSSKCQNNNQQIKQQSLNNLISSECIYIPKINNVSKNFVKKKQTIQKKNIFDNLYYDSIARQNRRKIRQYEQLKTCLHKPAIDKLSKQIVGPKKFQQRLQQYEVKKQIKSQKYLLEKQIKSVELHNPKIGKPPTRYNNQNLPIGQYLYQQAKRKKSKPKEAKIINFTNKNSQKFYQKMKKQAFQKIFQILDSDKNGKVNFVNINLLGLDKQVFNVIKPLLEQLQMLDIELTQQQFVQSISNLFQSLNVSDRNILLSQNPKKINSNKYTFQPQINPKSQQIASITQRSRMSIYQFCQLKNYEKQSQLEAERVQKTKKQMQNCTFHPKIHY